MFNINYTMRRFCTTSLVFYPKSNVKIYRKPPDGMKEISNKIKVGKLKNTDQVQPVKDGQQDTNEFSSNAAKIQMISNNLYKQIFKQNTRNLMNDYELSNHILELQRHGIDVNNSDCMRDVHINLPKLYGKNIEEHFYIIAKEQIKPYEKLIYQLVECLILPKQPINWSLTPGWTVYDQISGEGKSIEIPPEDALVLDVEVCVSEGATPTLATAVSPQNWYSWVCPRLANLELNSQEYHSYIKQKYLLNDLIPLGMKGPKIIVGHNVSYDRARLKEQYLLQDTGARFVDTMSLHICISGITSYQRSILKSNKGSSGDMEWQKQTSLNSLAEVHRLYCGGEPLSKDPRNIFINGSLQDIYNNFQSLMCYCAGDVVATFNILKKMYPLFVERFPHPATLSGILELGSTYLPVNSNWLRYIKESDLTYEDLNIEAKNHLSRWADELCRLLKGEKFREHLWLWDEDWGTQELKLKKEKVNLKRARDPTTKQLKCSNYTIEQELQKKFQYLYDMKTQLPARRPLLPGYPAWYRKLCKKPPKAESEICNWKPGATEIGTGMQIAPKLLSLCWEGYPLHYIREYGWGFLVPFKNEHFSTNTTPNNLYHIPIKQLVAKCSPLKNSASGCEKYQSEYTLDVLEDEIDLKLCKTEYYFKPQINHIKEIYEGSGVWCNKILEGCCYFLKLPHKNGKSFRVGNPLSKDFLNKCSDNILSSGDAVEGSAKRVIDIARMMSYWRNNRDRIINQMVVWFSENDAPHCLKNGSKNPSDFGAICPQIVACGTLTRRAMEPTWMTASNSQRERIGSELRSMVQAPPTYRIVGADVDSQELWIASVLGDAHESGIHGGTPLGWMTLSGSKSKGTDMHSMTAKAVGISRDHAKVINYARIYGAGQNFAEGLLKQFNPSLSDSEAKKKAKTMFSITKGKRVYKLKKTFLENYEDKSYTGYEALRLAASCNCSVGEMFLKPRWVEGTESAMFNILEKIASDKQPKTPFLGCQLSRALEMDENNENRFLTTRVNWVVQSGAVDFLHLMLVCMRWLMGPHARFCLSFHDEVRYLVKEEFAYKTALALHLTNLLTRSFCASRIGLHDLPMSVAFFSSVEVDTVLRKESSMDCKTPSNPHGLQIGYNIPPGENLTIYDAINKAGGADLTKWQWLKQ